MRVLKNLNPRVGGCPTGKNQGNLCSTSEKTIKIPKIILHPCLSGQMMGHLMHWPTRNGVPLVKLLLSVMPARFFISRYNHAPWTAEVLHVQSMKTLKQAFARLLVHRVVRSMRPSEILMGACVTATTPTTPPATESLRCRPARCGVMQQKSRKCNKARGRKSKHVAAPTGGST